MDANELRRKKDKAPFSINNIEEFSMYDSIPYTMDINVCPKESHKLISGNIIKFSTYNLSQTFHIKSV